MPGEDFHLSDLARFQAHPRTLSACGCVEGRGNPGYRFAFAQPGANVLAALPGCWFARRRREGNKPPVSEA